MTEMGIKVVIQVVYCCCVAQVACTIHYYTAAVYEHHAILNDNSTALASRTFALKFMSKNLDIYEQQVIAASKRGVEIIVFPEDGIHGFNYSRASIYPYLDYLPSPDLLPWNPCLDQDRFQDTEVLQRLSCMASKGAMFLVANLGTKRPCDPLDLQCPPDGRYQFNTDVVFDDKGTLVASYFKQNLYFEYGFDTPSEVQYAFFDTHFGRFGLFTCFDILFYEPVVNLIKEHQVRHLLYPTAWMNQLPLLSSIQIQRAFATRFQVNILAANIHHTTLGMTGSGIFSPSNSSYYYDMDTDQGHLIVAKVPVDPSEDIGPRHDEKVSLEHADSLGGSHFHTSVQICDKMDKTEHCMESRGHKQETFFHAKMMYDNFTFIPLKDNDGKVHVCAGALCCYLTYRKHNVSNELYALGVFDGLHTVHGTYSLQICALVKCGGPDMVTCGQEVTEASSTMSFQLWGRFSTKYIFPMIVTSGVTLQLPDHWGWKDQNCYMKKTDLELGLVTAALYGRVYERDIISR
ncbi:biotinidase [Bufo gargarizans]|uniref:biotinidase n=1 Tax=Bufo gargarizans TaxID=30331 RepID=UPI001CF448D6|nr:biotinidase [Bufo gargarizans]XP_044149665.1 biotinidase [Bufo gargarizans]